MILNQDPKAEEKFKSYPKEVKSKLEYLRKLVIECAKEIEGLEELEATLKWGEPSFLTKHGSTIRMDWKAKKPEQYAIYFKCTSLLVVTFKEVFGNQFNYENNRAILFKLNDKVPVVPLKKCIRAALNYHKVKNLPLLGM